MRISLRELSGSEFLAGSKEGQAVLSKLVAIATSPDEAEAVFLDLSDVAIATSSFIREGLLGFREYARSARPNLYPVVANANPTILEEIEFYLEARREALWSCELDLSGKATEPRLLGVLDPAARRTFEAVSQLRRATAADLASLFPEPAVKAGTAWNNRLASLARQGVLMELPGSSKVFTPVLGGR